MRLAVFLCLGLVSCVSPAGHSQSAPQVSPHWAQEKTFPYEEIHGRWLRTLVLGEVPKDRSLPPIILVHGYGSRLDAWATVHPRLAQHTQVVAYDMAGFGHSEKTEGEYGVDGLYVGVPCVLGAGGVERIIEVELDTEEQKMFDASVEHVKTLVEQIAL